MLGTNDKKAVSVGAAAIAGGIMTLWYCAATSCGPGGGVPAPARDAVCPPMLGVRADDPAWERYAEWRGGRAASQALPGVLAAACAAAGSGFVDDGHAASSDRDPIHWTDDMHPFKQRWPGASS